MAQPSWWRAPAVVAVGLMAVGAVVLVGVTRDRSDVTVAAPDAAVARSPGSAAGPSQVGTAPTASPTASSAEPDPVPAAGDSQPVDPAATDAPPATSGATPPAPPTAAVSVATFAFADATRPTAAHGGIPTSPQRRLPTTVWYPSGGGPYPLVVFGAGFANAANDYHDLLHEVASHGFVVAAPDFPLTSPVNTNAMVESDLRNEPADLAFVATQVGQARSLAGKVSAGDYAVMGHSDGATVALAAAYETCCRDDRIAAVVSLSGNTSGFRPATFPAGSPALLAVHGTADTTNAFANSQAAFAKASSPKYLLSVVGGAHEAPFTTDPGRPAISAVVAEFLRGTLQHDRSSLDRMALDGNAGGLLQLQAG